VSSLSLVLPLCPGCSPARLEREKKGKRDDQRERGGEGKSGGLVLSSNAHSDERKNQREKKKKRKRGGKGCDARLFRLCLTLDAGRQEEKKRGGKRKKTKRKKKKGKVAHDLVYRVFRKNARGARGKKKS